MLKMFKCGGLIYECRCIRPYLLRKFGQSARSDWLKVCIANLKWVLIWSKAVNHYGSEIIV